MATHNRAGEITYRQISELTYEFTLLTYTYTPSAANESRDFLEVQWGDNTSSFMPRIEVIHLPDNYDKNTYKLTHTFPGPGTYSVSMEDPNRNFGVNNIPGSVNVPFSITTVLQINSSLGFNNTPVLLNPPLDKAAVGEIFIHNPAAYDPDGDSISYKLTTCTGANGIYIANYSLPETSDTIYVDPLTGDFVWNAPVYVGIYNVAMLIEEWRNGVKIGKITRDMQIEVRESDNKPPILTEIEDICVEADSMVQFTVVATDPNNDVITLTAAGGPFMVDESFASFNQGNTGQGSVSSEFTWQTKCSHVRKNPYSVVFKACDSGVPHPIGSDSIVLVDLMQVNITVVAPSPKNFIATAANNSIFLTWNPCTCNQAIGYRIYRKVGSYGFHPSQCETGVPAYTGYQFLVDIYGYNNTSYLDNNNGEGLTQGQEYCYMVIAYFSDGAESYASEEVCTGLTKGIPVITNVSVNNTSQTNGSMYVAWAKPKDFDTIAAPGPYKYLIYRSQDLWGGNLQLIDSLSNINDTIWTDTLINTKDFAYSYKVEFYNDSPNNRFLMGAPQIASSVYLRIGFADNSLTLNFDKNVPWTNSNYEIYRYNTLSGAFSYLATTNQTSYTDNNLANGSEYCYRIKSIGAYSSPGFIDPIINYSQINCAVPKDTVAPCSPLLTGKSNCDSLRNELSWTILDANCLQDVVKYYIYYSSELNKPMIKIDSTYATEYIHYPNLSMAGCYAISAVDSFMNESVLSPKNCLDECSYYELPNVFTPNGDNHNDIYKPLPYRFVEKIDMKIYDRWGVLIFKTNDPDINWNGCYMDNNKIVTSGVYFYVCDVFEKRLSGLEPRYLIGFIHVYSDKKTIEP